MNTATQAPVTWRRHLEPQGFGLARLFILNTGSQRWAGRNRPVGDEQGQRRLSSILRPSMLLGPLEYLHWGNDGVAVFYHAATTAQKRRAFAQARHQVNSDICFPCPPLGPRGEEFICPPSFWECDAARAIQLNRDEGHFRRHCVAVLRKRLKPGAVIHDPACSTGELIAHLARALPHCRCLGSDRSASMIRHARARYVGLPVQFRQADAAVGTTACDALILRFLNAEVVDRHDADTLLRQLLLSLNSAGVALVFGHTPVLPAVPWVAQELGLVVEACIASRPGRLELFQCYVLRRPAP